MGYWVDTNNHMLPMTTNTLNLFMVVKSSVCQKLHYKGYTIPLSPKAGTGLSSHELNQPGKQASKGHIHYSTVLLRLSSNCLM